MLARQGLSDVGSKQGATGNKNSQLPPQAKKPSNYAMFLGGGSDLRAKSEVQRNNTIDSNDTKDRNQLVSR